MKPTLVIKIHDDLSDDHMMFLLMGLSALDSKFNLRLEGFKGIDMEDDLATISNKIMMKRMQAKI